MLLDQYTEKNKYTRLSKNGNEHTYFRNKTYIKLRCDCCMETFVRAKSAMDPKRLSNSYYHVCSNCDSKKFAQERGLEKRKIWNMKADSLIDISLL